MPEALRILVALVVTSFLATIFIAVVSHHERDRHGDDWQPDFEKAFKFVGAVWIGVAVIVGFLFMWTWAVGAL